MRISIDTHNKKFVEFQSSIFMSRLPTYNHNLYIQLEFFFHHDSNRSRRPCPGTRAAKLNVGQLHVLVTGPREASRWLWMLTFKNIYFNILSVLVLVTVPGLLWTSLKIAYSVGNRNRTAELVVRESTDHIPAKSTEGNSISQVESEVADVNNHDYMSIQC